MIKSFFNPEPVIFAYQGGVPSLPPNTLPSFEKGLEAGADVLATNVSLTADGELVAYRDLELKSMCGLDGKLCAHTLAELKKADAAAMFAAGVGEFPFRGKGMTIMTFEEMLSAFPSSRINAELMDNNAFAGKKFAELVMKTGSQERVLAASVYGSPLRVIRKKVPELATAFSLYGALGFYALFRTGFIALKNSFAPDCLQVPEVIGGSHIANQGLVKEARDRDIRVHIWDVKTRQQVDRLKSTGVDGYFTTDVAQLLEMLK